MEINYDKWKNRWSTNEIIVLVLLSLGMQIGLIILAPLRKRSKNPVLKITLWLLYLTADSVATLALGNISHQDDSAESGDSGSMQGKLTVLWAPFLLLHLGGPDSITSYSVEDNELWWRHLLGLVVQVVVTIYVFWQSPPKGLLLIPTMLVFIPGLIKFAERTHALRLGSKDNLKDKILSELGPPNRDKKVSTTSNPANPANGTTKGIWGILKDKIMAVFPAKDIRDSNNNTTSNPVDPANGTSIDSNNNTTSNPVDPANGTSIDSNNNTTSNPVDPVNGTSIDSNDNATSNPVNPANGITIDSNVNTTSNTADNANGTTKGSWGILKLFSAEYTTDEFSESEKDSKAICEGYYWFYKFKCLLVDVTFPGDMLMKSQDRFSELGAKDALELVAIELSFLYDILHTKAVHMHYNLGRALRFISMVSIIAALIVFHHLDMQNYESKDIIITYILFGAGLILEVIAAVLLVSSDWTVVSLAKKGWRKCIARAITSMVKGITLRKGKSRWSRNIGQFNLVGLCLREKYTPSTWIVKKLFIIKRKWDNMRESRSIPLLQGTLEHIMFTEAKRRAQNVHIYKVLVEARAYRGGKSLERHGQLDKLEWSLKREFDESIILWHVATDICYYENKTSNQPSAGNEEPSSQTNRENQELSHQPNGEKQEPSSQPNGEKQEPSSQPNVGNEEPSSQPNVGNEEPSSQPNVRNEEHSSQPNGRKEEPSNQPNGRKKIPINLTCGLKSCLSSKQPNGEKDTERDVSWKTSNYMIYLLTQQQSMMQLGYGKTRFEGICTVVKKILQAQRELDDKAGPTEQFACALVKKIFKGQRKLNDDKARRVLYDKSNNPVDDSTKDQREKDGQILLRDCHRLAKELQELKPEIKWKLISETWMEMLGYAAIHCDSYEHAKSLRRGGELLTHLWLLMSQLGVVEEHKVQQYQSATV